jgi:hypothetical protein
LWTVVELGTVGRIWNHGCRVNLTIIWDINCNVNKLYMYMYYIWIKKDTTCICQLTMVHKTLNRKLKIEQK